jgi:uncharacterized protein (TIGR02453 family)
VSVRPGFSGFPKECVKFYEGLQKNNNKQWFAEHKQDFEKYVMTAARDFVGEMGVRIQDLSSNVIADPRMDKSIFRPYRDTRFSADKSPYKTHLGIFFWEGRRPKMECSGYYFHLEPPNLMLAAGIHCFPRPILQQYRDSVVDPKHGVSLAKAVSAVEKKGPYVIGGTRYKKTPRGYDPDHKNAALLLHDGLYASVTARIPRELYSKGIIDYCFKIFSDISPVHRWLVEMTGRVFT